jgi:hypothetical protein
MLVSEKGDPKIVAKVQKDADEFLRRVKDGLI